jgi:diphthine synthase
MLFLIGLGLGDEKDITVKGLEIVRRCAKVFLESYTAILGVDRAKLQEFYKVWQCSRRPCAHDRMGQYFSGPPCILRAPFFIFFSLPFFSFPFSRERGEGRVRQGSLARQMPILEADREFVEQKADKMIIDAAKDQDVALLVVGDPLGATTHSDLMLRAAEKKVKVQVVHNASILNASGVCGLQLYSFGQTVTIPFFTERSRPESIYDKIKLNRSCRFHTLCLLDIQVKEQTFENLLKGNRVFEPPRFMSVRQGLLQLLELEDKRQEGVVTRDSPCIGLARVGRDDQLVASGTVGELLGVDFGAPLHSFVLPGDMHVLEKEMFDFWHWTRTAAGQRVADAASSASVHAPATAQ